MTATATNPGTFPVGGLFVLGFHGTTVPDWLRAFAARFGLGGVILFDVDARTRRPGRNVASPQQVRALCAEVAALPGAPLVLVDQEGGRVRRLKEALGFAPLPAARDFARLPEAERRAVLRRSYGELRALGIHLNLAPVVDLDLNPDSPDIGASGRSYSADPAVVRANVRLVDEAARAVKRGLCLKHYPGLGAATADTHRELTDLGAALNDAELSLFHDLAPAVHGGAVLVSHGIVPQWEPGRPASMSPVALGTLRAHVPDVLVLSDDLQMRGLQLRFGTAEACRQGLAAGLDLLVLGNNLLDESAHMAACAESLGDAVAADPRLRERAEAALARVGARKALLRG